MYRFTELSSPYRHLEQMSVRELLIAINNEDHRVAKAVRLAIDQITALAEEVVDRLLAGGRLIYVGAGTSGRLGVVDAAECPPTYGVEPSLVVGVIAGGMEALVRAQEGAEDNREQAVSDMEGVGVERGDVVVGISASGTTPYVVAAVAHAKHKQATTGCITCNRGTPLAELVDYPVEVVVGGEFVSGSTRMKAGTAQKLVLNMLSTVAMIKIGRVMDNRMVDMRLSSAKLRERGARIVAEMSGVSVEVARQLLEHTRSVRGAVELATKHIGCQEQ